MTPADTALSLLRESRDGERDEGRIFTDNGATVTRLAQACAWSTCALTCGR